MARVDEEVDGGRRAAERDELGAALLPVRREREGRRDAARRAPKVSRVRVRVGVRVRVRVRVRITARVRVGPISPEPSGSQLSKTPSISFLGRSRPMSGIARRNCGRAVAVRVGGRGEGGRSRVRLGGLS